MSRRGCEARQYSDQMNCPRCGLVWDMNDPEPPECLTTEQIHRAHFNRVKKEVFKDESDSPTR